MSKKYVVRDEIENKVIISNVDLETAQVICDGLNEEDALEGCSGLFDDNTHHIEEFDFTIHS